ncbi:EAL domain-containing protein [Marinomonas sp. A79]|uniref:EAL domain-containing protein n=1 Tax=Marinomonas vulgaris TaxID=2823372 RepID=A0ABS5HF53_9GAMM|nr:EAL domain-containing protein [Marinomonas vulgaris]MBR7890271.1 EAL domain-containing protein [Marinomonas vulgaris]
MKNILNDLGLLYQAMMDSAADAIVVINEKGIILHFSKSAEALFQRSVEECTYQNVNILMPEPYKHAHDSYLDNYHKTGDAKIIGSGRDVKGIKKDGTEFPMHLSVGKAVIKDHIYYIGICHDLSDYKQTLSAKLQLESLQNALFDAAVNGIITINIKGIITSFNRAAEAMFGYTKEETIGQNVKMLMPSPYHGDHDSYLQNYSNTGKAQIIGTGRDVPGRKKDGRIFPMRLSIGEAKTELGTNFIGICHDLTDYQNALIELSQAEQRYKSIVECQGQIICRLDTDFKLTFANQSFYDVFECTNQEVVGLNFVNFLYGNKNNMKDTLHTISSSQDATQIKCNATMRRKSGLLQVEWWFTKVNNHLGLSEIQGFGIDVSEKEEALREAAFLKNHDTLTGLLNAEAFFLSLQKWASTERFAIFYLDCNRFSMINNRYGINVGDQILTEIADRIKSNTHQNILLSRPSSDEFIIAVFVNDATRANNIAEAVLEKVNKPYLIDKKEIRISGKIGISIYPDDTKNIDHVVLQAQSVLSKARSSQNDIAFYDEKFNACLQRQLDIEQRLIVALEQDILKVHLQPKVNLYTDEIIGYEALLRWNDPVLGRISPVEFIQVAEKMLLAKEVDRYVLKTVFNCLSRCLNDKRKVLPIAVNITSSHFNDAALASYIFSLSDELEVPLTYLDLEVTEGVLLEMNQQVLDNLHSLRLKGIGISLDDFGTGYSSLSYIRKLAVDELKIDKSFVDDVHGEVGQRLVAAVIDIAKAVNLEVIAEGIETEAQRQILMKLGCRIGQGYLFAKPDYICKVLNLTKA